MVKINGFLVQHFGIKADLIGEVFIVKQLVSGNCKTACGCGKRSEAKKRSFLCTCESTFLVDHFPVKE